MKPFHIVMTYIKLIVDVVAVNPPQELELENGVVEDFQRRCSDYLCAFIQEGATSGE
jgi:hypothetical protein